MKLSNVKAKMRSFIETHSLNISLQNPKIQSLFERLGDSSQNDKDYQLSDAYLSGLMNEFLSIQEVISAADSDNNGNLSGEEKFSFLKNDMNFGFSDKDLKGFLNIEESDQNEANQPGDSFSYSDGSDTANIRGSSRSRAPYAGLNNKNTSDEDDETIQDEEVLSAKEKKEKAEEEYNTEYLNAYMELPQLEQSIEDTNNLISTSNENITAYKQEQDSLKTQISDIDTQISSLQSEIASLSASEDDEDGTIAAQISNLESQIAALEAEKQAKENEISDLDNSIAQEENNIQQYNQAIEETKNAIEEMNAKIEELSTAYEDANAEYEKVLADYEKYHEMEENDFTIKDTKWDENDIEGSIEEKLSVLGVSSENLDISKGENGIYTAVDENSGYKNVYKFDKKGNIISYSSDIGVFSKENDNIYFEHTNGAFKNVKDEIAAKNIETIIKGSSNNNAPFNVRELLADEKNLVKNNAAWNKPDLCVQYTKAVFAKYGLDMPKYSRDVYSDCMRVANSQVKAGDLCLVSTKGKMSEGKSLHVGVVAAVIPLENGKNMYITVDKSTYQSSVNIRYEDASGEYIQFRRV